VLANFSKASPPLCLCFIAGLVVILGLTGCNRKSGKAIVIGKEYIAAMQVTPTPNEEGVATLAEQTARPNELVTSDEETDAVLHEEVPLQNPRATHDEQWIVDVEMIEGGRKIAVRVDQPRWEKVKEGDQVRVTYKEGQYTGTVWSAEMK
jgi:hypothetical protein